MHKHWEKILIGMILVGVLVVVFGGAYIVKGFESRQEKIITLLEVMTANDTNMLKALEFINEGLGAVVIEGDTTREEK